MVIYIYYYKPVLQSILIRHWSISKNSTTLTTMQLIKLTSAIIAPLFIIVMFLIEGAARTGNNPLGKAGSPSL